MTNTVFLRYRFWILLAMAVLITAMGLQYHFNHYRLIFFPGYDDVSYLASASEWYESFYQHGPLGFIKAYFHNGPHAPITELQAAVGFMLFGFNTWAAYPTNILLIGLYLVFSDRWLKNLSWGPRLAGYFFAACVPFVGYFMLEFRPDMLWGILTAFGTLMAINEKWLIRSRKYLIAWGLIFGLSLLAKPSTFPATMVFYGLSLGFTILHIRLTEAVQPTWRQMLRNAGIVLLVTLAVASIYFIDNFKQIVDYIYAALVTDGNVWGNDLGFLDSLNYYLFGGAGDALLHRYLWYILVLIAVALAWVLGTRDRLNTRRIGCVLGMGFFLYLIPTVTSMKSPPLGSVFAAGAIYCGLMAIDYLLTRPFFFAAAGWSGWARRGGAVALLVFLALYGFKWPAYQGDRNLPRVKWENSLFDGVYAALSSRMLAQQPQRIVLATEGPVMSQGLKFRARLDHWPELAVDCVAMQRTLPAAMDIIKGADFVLAQQANASASATTMPIVPNLDAMLTKLDHNPDYRPIYTATAYNGKRIVLFQHVGPFYGVQRTLGTDICPENTWCGQETGSSFAVTDAGAAPRKLVIEAKPLLNVTSVDVLVDGRKMSTHAFASGAKAYETFSMPVELSATAPAHVIRLEYHLAPGEKNPPDQAVQTLQIRRMQLQSQPSP